MPPLLMAAIAAAFIAVAVTSGSVAWVLLERNAPDRRRLQRVVAQARAVPVAAGPTTLSDRPGPLIERIVSFVPKPPGELNKLRRRLVRAGYHSMTAAVVFSIGEIVTPVVLAVPVLILLPWPRSAALAGFAAVVGFMLPSVILGRMIDRRRQAITNGLPDVLDLLIVCLEAGCSLDQAIAKATEELAIAYPALSEELRMLSTETRAGKPRIEAFRNLEARTKNDDIRSLVAMLVQTDRFGTSVSQALRTFAEVARTKRRQRAEEKAAKIGVKMVFPLVLCLFPALYVVTLGPAVIQIIRVFIGGVAQ